MRTVSQNKAIFSRRSDVLVSASAGSGKTSAMIDRMVSLIEEGVSVSELLAVTFTRLAAEEMRARIREALSQKAAENSRYNEELKKLPTAQISTIHSFLGDTLRLYFFEAGVDPSFEIADETTADIMRRRVLDEIFEEKYAEGEERFMFLADAFRRRRKDEYLKGVVLDLYIFAESETDALLAFRRAIEYLTVEKTAKMRDFFAFSAQNKLKPLIKSLKKVKLYDIEKYNTNVDCIVAWLEYLLTAEDYDEFCARGESPNFPKKPSLLKNADLNEIEASDEYTAVIKKIKKVFADFDFSIDMALEEDKLPKLRYISEELIALYEAFLARYTSFKREENKLDFSDLEHLSLKLFNGKILEDVRSRYKYILVDEYQDVNGVQEEIFRLLGRGNVFMVGDVKQSIYGFRGCNPDIFAEKFEKFKEKSPDSAISFLENFRCSDAVIAAVNKTFSPIMRYETSKVDYENNKMLRGGLYEDGSGEAYLHILSDEREKRKAEGVYSLLDDIGSDDEEVKEGVLVAKIISEQIGKKFYDVKEKDTRRCGYGDIVVLYRSMSGGMKLIKELVRAGIPVTYEAKGKVTERSEIAFIVELLRLIDCVEQDIPLVAVMKSKIGGFNDEELLLIRENERKKRNGGDKLSFYRSAKNYAEDNISPLAVRLKEFFEYINKIRLLADFTDASTLLFDIISEKNLDVELLTSPLGEQKLANVVRFILSSIIGDKKLSVGEFLERIEADGEISASEVASDDTVRVMSIHASKGLEFPIVIIYGLEKKFNYSDANDSAIVISRDEGFATCAYDEATRTYSSSVYKKYLSEKLKIKMCVEEMRVLYVAMTRARYALHLVTAKEVGSSVDDPPSARCYADLITKDAFFVKRYAASELTRAGERDSGREVVLGEPDADLTEKMRILLGWKYKYSDETLLPVKDSATSAIDDGSGNYTYQTLDGEHTKREYIWDDGGGEGDGLARERGIMYHAYLEAVDFSSPNVESVRQALRQKNITEEKISLVDEGKINAIFHNALFQRLVDEGYELYREQPFVCYLPTKLLPKYKDKDGEVLIQGVIDLLAEKDGEFLVIDYKYSQKSESALIEKYAAQLNIYAAAVGRVFGKYPREKLIVDLISGSVIKVE